MHTRKRLCALFALTLAFTSALLGNSLNDYIEKEGAYHFFRVSPPLWWKTESYKEAFYRELLFSLVAAKVVGSDPSHFFTYDEGVLSLSCSFDEDPLLDQRAEVLEEIAHLLRSSCFCLEEIAIKKVEKALFEKRKKELKEELVLLKTEEDQRDLAKVITLANELTAKEFNDSIEGAVIQLGALFSHLYEETERKLQEEAFLDLTPLDHSYTLVNTISFFENRYQEIGEGKKGKIVDLIHYMGYKEKKWLLKRAKTMRALGKAVDDVHPFLFLTVIRREKDRKGLYLGLRECLKRILSDPFKKLFFIYGEPFRDGLKHKIQKLKKEGKIEPYLIGFAAAIDQDEKKIRECIQKGAWEELLQLVAF